MDRYDASHHGQYSVDIWAGHRCYNFKLLEREIGSIYSIRPTWRWHLSWSLGSGYWVRRFRLVTGRKSNDAGVTDATAGSQLGLLVMQVFEDVHNSQGSSLR